MGIDRRTFLIGTGGVVAAGVAAERTTAWARRRPVGRWADALAWSASARDLGVEYLTRHPDEADRSRLLAGLAGLVRPSALLRGAAHVPAGFNARVRRDFVDGDVVGMGGWQLSRTELRLCALAALEAREDTGVHGVFRRQDAPGGGALFWTAPTARFTVPASEPAPEFQLCSGAPEPQRVSVSIDGVVVDELIVSGREWHRRRYAMKPGRETPIALTLTTTPSWMPRHDFRTLGVGIDRIWSA